MLIALVLIGLYIWTTVDPTEANAPLAIPTIAAIAAGLTFAVTLALYFLTPVNRTRAAAMTSHALLLMTLWVVLFMTQGSESAFLGLFIVIVTLTVALGPSGIGLAVLALASFLLWEFFGSGISMSKFIVLAVTGATPLLAAILLWGREDPGLGGQSHEERSYNELASELSQVAGKSEVVINAITDGVLALDSQGTIQLINPAAQTLVGWGKHDAVTLSYKSVLKILNAKNIEVTPAEDPVAQALMTNQPVKTDNLNIQTQSGKNFMAAISVSPVGQLGKGVIVVFRDITTERSDERQRAEFISTASHEMRTPVASIEGYLGLALNPATASIDAKARDFITKAHESAQHLGRLFQDLLDVSRADDGRLTNNPTVIDIVPFVHEIVLGLTPKANAKGLSILYKPMPDGDNDDLARRINPVYYVNVDADHLREISDNLLENAIKYTLKGNVVVDIGGDETHVVISIQDTGIGIPREDQAHLFQKFYRVDNSDTREIGGTGLGLYLCRRLAESMGGRIWVESEYKKGSTFFVELPRIDHDEATRLIEQASILAEQRAEAEAAQAARDAQAAQAAQIANMSTSNAFMPPVAPQAPVITEPLPPAPPQPVPQAPEPYVATPQPAPNTPLSSIEANPGQYLSRPTSMGINIPPRQQ